MSITVRVNNNKYKFSMNENDTLEVRINGEVTEFVFTVDENEGQEIYDLAIQEGESPETAEKIKWLKLYAPYLGEEDDVTTAILDEAALHVLGARDYLPSVPNHGLKLFVSKGVLQCGHRLVKLPAAVDENTIFNASKLYKKVVCC
jgi:hypothetical protein